VIKDANVVLYDKLVDDRIVALVPDGTELLDVGKDSNYHTVPQQQDKRAACQLRSSRQDRRAGQRR